jgi:exopolysaccharide production protein ExoQ
MTANPTAIERCWLVFALSLLNATPLLIGQPQGALSLNPVEYLENVSIEGDPKKQTILLGLYLGCVILLLSRTRPRTWLFLGTPLLLLIGWSVASVGWSVSPAVSLRRAIALLGTVAFGTYAGLRFDFRDMLRLMSYTAAIVLIGSLIVAVVMPALGLDYDGRLRGVFAHKNALGGYAALSFLVLVSVLLETKYRSKMVAISDGLLVVICIACMAFARSAAVIPVLMIALPLLLVGRIIRIGDFGVLALVPIVMIIAGIALAAAVYNSAAIAAILGKDPDISGRILVWDFAFRMILEHPWLGYGYEAFWVGEGSPGAVFWRLSHLGVPHAHNGYLQLTLDLGSIGLALFLIALIVVAVKLAWLLRFRRQPLTAWALGFLGFDLAANLSETLLWVGNELLSILFVYVVVRTNIEMRKAVVEAAAAAADRIRFYNNV